MIMRSDDNLIKLNTGLAFLSPLGGAPNALTILILELVALAFLLLRPLTFSFALLKQPFSKERVYARVRDSIRAPIGRASIEKHLATVPCEISSKAETYIFQIKDLPGETIVPICSYGTSALTSSESAYDRGLPRLRGGFYSRRSATRSSE